jgi:excisionase family DNA binding protein
MKTFTSKSTPEDQVKASQSLDALSKSASKSKKEKGAGVFISHKGSQEPIEIPKPAMELLVSLLEMMAAGKTVTLVASQQMLTTQEAADFLKVSRPYLVKLLETGAIPFKKTGSHRRVQVDDLVAFSILFNAEREANLDFLAKQAQELQMGYE